MTGMVTAFLMPSIICGSDMRATPPSARMSAGMPSRAMTATAPAASACVYECERTLRPSFLVGVVPLCVGCLISIDVVRRRKGERPDGGGVQLTARRHTALAAYPLSASSLAYEANPWMAFARNGVVQRSKLNCLSAHDALPACAPRGDAHNHLMSSDLTPADFGDAAPLRRPRPPGKGLTTRPVRPRSIQPQWAL